MFTNTSSKPVQPKPGDIRTSCVTSYDDFKAQRILKDNISFQSIQQATTLFRTDVIGPLEVARPNLEMGEYFVIPVSEIQAMLAACPAAEYVHITNAIRSTQNSRGDTMEFPVVIITPIVKLTRDGNLAYDVFQTEAAMYCEGFPCPPDPSCPKSAGIGTILGEGTEPNDFNSLF